MTDTPRLLLPLVAAAQAQKHVTVNEALMRLDAVVHLAVSSRALLAPPDVPVEGGLWVAPAGSTGAWAGRDGEIAWRLDGVWEFLTPRPGWLCWVEDEALLVRWTGSAWAAAAPAASAAGAPRPPAFTVATLPAASEARQLVYVSDGASNRHLAVSDGEVWRWMDGAVVS